MKKYTKIIIIFLISFILFLSSIPIIKKLYIQRVKEIYHSCIIYELNLDTEFNIISIERFEDKTDYITYELDLGKINGFDITAKISNITNILKPTKDTTIKVNIEDFDVANLLLRKYGDKYNVTKVIINGGRNNVIISSNKYSGAYQFALKNKINGNMVTGCIPSNKNLDEMFDVNEKKDLDFEF